MGTKYDSVERINVLSNVKHNAKIFAKPSTAKAAKHPLAAYLRERKCRGTKSENSTSTVAELKILHKHLAGWKA